MIRIFRFTKISNSISKWNWRKALKHFKWMVSIRCEGKNFFETNLATYLGVKKTVLVLPMVLDTLRLI
jgi:hypothetical protein